MNEHDHDMRETLPAKINYAVNDFIYAVRSFQMKSWEDVCKDWEGRTIYGVLIVVVAYYLFLIFG